MNDKLNLQKISNQDKKKKRDQSQEELKIQAEINNLMKPAKFISKAQMKQYYLPE